MADAGTLLQIVTPDLIFGPDGEGTNVSDDPLNPCPVCNSTPHEAPEGIHDYHSVRKNPGTSVGDAKWNFPHCWKCGFRPGVNTAISEASMRAAYERFKQQITDHVKGLMADNANAAKTLSPPANEAEMANLKAELQAAQQREAELRAQLESNPANDKE